MTRQPIAVDKAAIASSYEVAQPSGRVRKIRVPDFIETDERGVLRAVYVRGRR